MTNQTNKQKKKSANNASPWKSKRSMKGRRTLLIFYRGAFILNIVQKLGKNMY